MLFEAVLGARHAVMMTSHALSCFLLAPCTLASLLPGSPDADAIETAQHSTAQHSTAQHIQCASRRHETCRQAYAYHTSCDAEGVLTHTHAQLSSPAGIPLCCCLLDHPVGAAAAAAEPARQEGHFGQRGQATSCGQHGYHSPREADLNVFKYQVAILYPLVGAPVRVCVGDSAQVDSLLFGMIDATQLHA